MQYIIILGAFQALVAFMLHYSGREKKPADVLLSLMLLCLVTHLSIKFVIYTFSDNSTLKLGFNTFIDLAYGPLLWIFASRFQNDTKQLGKQCYLFLPTFFAALLYMMIIAGFLTHRGWAVGFLRVYNNITGYLIILSFSFFPLLTLHRLKTFGVFWKVEKVLIKRIAVLFLTLSGFWLGGKFVDSLNLFDAAIIPGIMRTVTYTILLGISILILHYRLMSQHWQRTAPEEPDSPPAVPEINLSAPLNREEPDFNHPPDVLTEACIFSRNNRQPLPASC
jgi:hypothetical protein